MTGEERRAQAQQGRLDLLKENRAKFIKNRIVYVTPNGIHTAHDVQDIESLKQALRDENFEIRGQNGSGPHLTTDYFRHEDGTDFWESYVITEK